MRCACDAAPNWNKLSKIWDAASALKPPRMVTRAVKLSPLSRVHAGVATEGHPYTDEYMAKDKKENPPEPANPAEQRTAFERVQLARHADRPYTLDLIERLFEDFVELHGDKRFAEDPAIVCGLARFHGLPVIVVGHQKGRDTKQRSYRNFGMPKPEGYRKALRIMTLGEKFGRPILTFIAPPGT